MFRNTPLRGVQRPRRCMGIMEWVGWIGLALIVYYLYERIQEFEDIMPPDGVRHTSLSRRDNTTSIYKHVMRHTKHEDSSSKGMYKWVLGKFKIQTTTHLDENQYKDSLRAITTGRDYGNHGSFALPDSNNQNTDRIEEHATFDELVRQSQGDEEHIQVANLDVDAENDKRIERETNLLDQFAVSTLHSVEKFHWDADTLKPHIEKPEEDNVRKMNVTIIDNKKMNINVIRTRRRILRGES